MAASMAANTPSKTIDSEPDNRPNSTPNSETRTVTPIDRRSRRCSAVAWGMAAAYRTFLHASSPPSGGEEHDGQIGKIRQVVVPWAKSLPALS